LNEALPDLLRSGFSSTRRLFQTAPARATRTRPGSQAHRNVGTTNRNLGFSLICPWRPCGFGDSATNVHIRRCRSWISISPFERGYLLAGFQILSGPVYLACFGSSSRLGYLVLPDHPMRSATMHIRNARRCPQWVGRTICAVPGFWYPHDQPSKNRNT